jgi:DNA-binding XRE family transcriptional regulator
MAGMTEDKRIKREWGARIRMLRMDEGLTRFALGGIIGVSPKTIQAWEDGRSFPDDLSVLSRLKESGVDALTELSAAMAVVCGR